MRSYVVKLNDRYAAMDQTFDKALYGKTFADTRASTRKLDSSLAMAMNGITSEER